MPLSAWLTEGHSLCGVSVARTFGKTSKLFLGRVTRRARAATLTAFPLPHDLGSDGLHSVLQWTPCGCFPLRMRTCSLHAAASRRWLPAIDAPLFKVEHDDGDVEDLE